MEGVAGEVSVVLAAEAGAVPVEVAAPPQPWDTAEQGHFSVSRASVTGMALSNIKARLDEVLSNLV